MAKMAYLLLEFGSHLTKAGWETGALRISVLVGLQSRMGVLCLTRAYKSLKCLLN